AAVEELVRVRAAVVATPTVGVEPGDRVDIVRRRFTKLHSNAPVLQHSSSVRSGNLLPPLTPPVAADEDPEFRMSAIREYGVEVNAVKTVDTSHTTAELL